MTMKSVSSSKDTDADNFPEMADTNNDFSQNQYINDVQNKFKKLKTRPQNDSVLSNFCDKQNINNLIQKKNQCLLKTHQSFQRILTDPTQSPSSDFKFFLGDKILKDRKDEDDNKNINNSKHIQEYSGNKSQNYNISQQRKEKYVLLLQRIDKMKKKQQKGIKKCVDANQTKFSQDYLNHFTSIENEYRNNEKINHFTQTKNSPVSRPTGSNGGIQTYSGNHIQKLISQQQTQMIKSSGFIFSTKQLKEECSDIDSESEDSILNRDFLEQEESEEESPIKSVSKLQRQKKMENSSSNLMQMHQQRENTNERRSTIRNNTMFSLALKPAGAIKSKQQNIAKQGNKKVIQNWNKISDNIGKQTNFMSVIQDKMSMSLSSNMFLRNRQQQKTLIQIPKNYSNFKTEFHQIFDMLQLRIKLKHFAYLDKVQEFENFKKVVFHYIQAFVIHRDEEGQQDIFLQHKISQSLIKIVIEKLQELMQKAHYSAEYIDQVTKILLKNKHVVEEGSILQELGGSANLYKMLQNILQEAKVFFKERNKILEILDKDQFLGQLHAFICHICQDENQNEQFERIRYYIQQQNSIQLFLSDLKQRERLTEKLQWFMDQDENFLKGSSKKQQLLNSDLFESLKQQLCQTIIQTVFYRNNGFFKCSNLAKEFEISEHQFKEMHSYIKNMASQFNLDIVITSLKYSYFQINIMLNIIQQVFLQDISRKMSVIRQQVFEFKSLLTQIGGMKVLIQLLTAFRQNYQQFPIVKDYFDSCKEELTHITYQDDWDNNSDQQQYCYSGLYMLEIFFFGKLSHYDVISKHDILGGILGLNISRDVCIQWKIMLEKVLKLDPFNKIKPTPNSLKSYDIVIVGANMGGILSRQLETLLKQRFNVFVVYNSQYVHCNHLDIAFQQGYMSQDKFYMDVGKILSPNTAHSDGVGIEKYLPEENSILLTNGRRISYKQLVISTGLRQDLDQIKGLKTALEDNGHPVFGSYIDSIAKIDSAKKPTHYYKFQGGKSIFYIPPFPIQGEGAHYNFFAAFDSWKENQKKLFDNLEIEFQVINANSSFAQNSTGLNEFIVQELRNRGIKYRLNTKMTEINKNDRKISIVNEDNQNETLEYDNLYTIIPTKHEQRLVDASLSSDESNFQLDVDRRTLQHNKYPNIFGLGDVCNLPTTKSFSSSQNQLNVVRNNVFRNITGQYLNAFYDGFSKVPIYLSKDKLTSFSHYYDNAKGPMSLMDSNGGSLSLMRYYMYSLTNPLWNTLYYSGKIFGPPYQFWLKQYGELEKIPEEQLTKQKQQNQNIYERFQAIRRDQAQVVYTPVSATSSSSNQQQATQVTPEQSAAQYTQKESIIAPPKKKRGRPKKNPGDVTDYTSE